ncbi:MAG: hypothetical protein AABY00_03365 [Nanoarchaeota archaeon]
MNVCLRDFHTSQLLAKFILDPKNHDDSSPGGHTNFISLELAVEQAPTDQKRTFAQALKGLDAYFATLHQSHFGFIHDLIGCLKETPYATEVAYHFHTCLNSPALRENMRKRGRILESISEYGNSLTPEMLEEETEVRAQYPWMWIDTMSNLHSECAKNSVLQQPQTEDNERAILVRLAHWRKEEGEELTAQFIKQIYMRCPSYRRSLEAYSKRHKLDIQF